MGETVIAIDVGGTNVRTAVLDRTMHALTRTHRPLDKSSPAALLECMASSVADVLPDSEQARGIGVAMKGLVDHERGVMVSSGSLGMEGLPVRAFLSDRFGLLTAVDNDVHAATIGEIYYGAGRRFDHFLYVNVGTGIAAGLVFDGRLYRGADNLSGEFGHNTVDRHGWPCPCGIWGCLEAVVSGPGIVAQVQEKLEAGPLEAGPGSVLAAAAASGSLSATAVWRAARQGDALAIQISDEVVEYLGTGLVNLVNLLNPQAIILGGGVFTDSGDLARRMERFVKSHVGHSLGASLQEVRLTSLGVNDVGLVGAAGLVYQYEDLFSGSGND